MYKRLFSVCLILSALQANALELSTFNDVATAIAQGKFIASTFDFSKCTPSYPMTAFHHPHTILVLKDHLSFADNHITSNNPMFPEQAVLENVTYRLEKSGAFTIKTKLFDPHHYEPLPKEITTMTCELSKGAHIFVR